LEILLAAGYTSLFIFLIGKMNFFRMEEISLNFIKTGFLIKVFAGIVVGLVYTFYYTDRLTADTFKFFDDSEILYNSLRTKPYDFIRMLTGIGAGAPELNHYYNSMTNWYDIFSPFNDNRTMVRFNALVRIFSFGYYYVHVVFICFLSLTGIIAIVKVFKEEFPGLALEVYMILLLLPSVLFWGSGLLKDALVYFSFGMVLFTFNKMSGTQKFSFRELSLFLISMVMLLMTKFQVFMLILPILGAWWIVARYRTKAFPTFFITHIIFFGLMFLPVKIFAGYQLTELLVQKQQAFFVLAEASKAGSAIIIPALSPDITSFITNAPIGFITAFTRPFITDTGPVMMVISAIENTLILLFGLYCLFRFNKSVLRGKVLPSFCLFYTLTYFTLIGMITPVLGAIVRYKAQALPYLVIMFVIVSYSGKETLVKKLYTKFTGK